MRKILTLCLLFSVSPLLWAQNASATFSNNVNNFFKPVLYYLDKVLFGIRLSAMGLELGVKFPYN